MLLLNPLLIGLLLVVLGSNLLFESKKKGVSDQQLTLRVCPLKLTLFRLFSCFFHYSYFSRYSLSFSCVVGLPVDNTHAVALLEPLVQAKLLVGLKFHVDYGRRVEVGLILDDELAESTVAERFFFFFIQKKT